MQEQHLLQEEQDRLAEQATVNSMFQLLQVVMSSLFSEPGSGLHEQTSFLSLSLVALSSSPLALEVVDLPWSTHLT